MGDEIPRIVVSFDGSRLTLGSVTMKVVHHASCPILVVPPDRTADVAVDEHVEVAQ